MARKQAPFPGGPRLSDYLSVGVIGQVFPVSALRAALAATGRQSIRQRDLPAEAMMYYVIALGLFRSVSAREVLRCLVEGLRWVSLPVPGRVPGKSSISRARARLGIAPFEVLREARVRPVGARGTRGVWYREWRLMGFDGSTLNVPDEAGNREAFGLPGERQGRSAFPQVRLTTLMELGTRACVAWTQGPIRESEVAQAERLLDRFTPGMLVVADRNYGGYPLWERARATGADLLWRFQGRTRLPVRRRLADGSFLSELRASGRDRRRSHGVCPVRVVLYRLAEDDNEVYRLVTTVLDPARAPAAELAALYHERWEIENGYDEIKTHLLGPAPRLRGKTPELVRQEIEGLLLAHYAVRYLMHQAAREADEDPDDLSFLHTVRVLRRRLLAAGDIPPSGPDPSPPPRTP